VLADEAFEEFYRRHRPGLTRFITSRVRDRTTARDLVQEVYTKAYQNRERFDPERSFGAWIYTIARNACVDHLRRRLRDPLGGNAPNAPVDPPDLDSFADRGASDPQRAAEQNDLIMAVRRELARLPDERRAAVEMKILDGLTFRETAEALGVPLGTVAYWVRESLDAVAARLRNLES